MSKKTINESKKNPPFGKLIPVPQWEDFHPWPPVGGLRHLIFNSKTNGFGSAFKKVGGRILVDESEFFKCVAKQNGEK